MIYASIAQLRSRRRFSPLSRAQLAQQNIRAPLLLVLIQRAEPKMI
jgi:hypothetical protein